MWVIYRKQDKKVVGFSADSEIDVDKDFAIKEILSGLVEGGSPEKHDAVQIRNRDEAAALMNATPKYAVLREGKSGLQVEINRPVSLLLNITCDAPDVHPVDGVPEIKGDGKSYTTITVKKTDSSGKDQTDKGDTDQLYLRTDHGTIMDAKGLEAINSIELKKGQAKFRFVSEKAKRVATIHVFNADHSLADAAIRVEMI